MGIETVLGHEKLDVYRLSIGYREESRQRNVELDRIAAMLSRLGGRGYSVKERLGEYGYTEFDPDPDSDFDKI